MAVSPETVARLLGSERHGFMRSFGSVVSAVREVGNTWFGPAQ